MIRIAYGEELAFGQDDIRMEGWAMGSAFAGIHEGLPAINWTIGAVPGAGNLGVGITKNVRMDGGINEGDEINRFYDLIAKLVTNGDTPGGDPPHVLGIG